MKVSKYTEKFTLLSSEKLPSSLSLTRYSCLKAIGGYTIATYTASHVPSPSYEKIEKGSGQKGRISASQRNAIIAIKMCIK